LKGFLSFFSVQVCVMQFQLMKIVKKLLEMKLHGLANLAEMCNPLWIVFLFNLLIMANASNLGSAHTTTAWCFLSSMPLKVGNSKSA